MFISTQGPTTKTFNRFWKMIYQNKCRVIIMLCNLYEDLMVKCDKYWPDEPGQVKIYNNEVEVEMISQIELMKGLIIERNFKVTLVNDQQKDYLSKILKESLIVSQYHVTCWPDHGIPNSDYSFNIITFLLKKIKENYNYCINNNIMYSPTVVHCSAGIGRTGTFMAIYNIYDHLNAQLNNFKKCKKINSNNSSININKTDKEDLSSNIFEQKVNDGEFKRKSTTKVKFLDINTSTNNRDDIFFSVFSIVRKLREQRFMLVTDLVQYKFLYKFAYNWINYNFFNKKDISMDIELIDEETFKKDYSYLKNELNISEQNNKKIKKDQMEYNKEPKSLKCHLPTSKNKNSKKIDFDYKETSSKMKSLQNNIKSSKNMAFSNKKIDFSYNDEIIEENENINSPDVKNIKVGKETLEEIEPFNLQTNIPPITPKVKNKMNLFLNLNNK